MPTAANRKPVTRLQARTQLTFTEPSTVDPTQEQEQPASDIEDSDSEVTLRLPEPTFEQPSPINHPTATPARQSGLQNHLPFNQTALQIYPFTCQEFHIIHFVSWNQ